MEPPVRPASSRRRARAADRRPFARRPPAALAAALALSAGLGVGCAPRSLSDAEAEGGRAAALLVLPDAASVAPGEEGSFDDLPGVDGFDRLSPEQQARVVDRANRTRCDCGCPGHSVNHCLHQRETCEVAVRLARSFVDDARAHELHAGGLAPAPEEPSPQDPTTTESAEPDAAEGAASGDAT